MNSLKPFIETFLTQIGVNSATKVFNNTLAIYVEAIVAFVAFLIIFKIFQWLILRNLFRIAKKTKTDIDDTLIEIVKSLRPPFYSFLAFYFAVKILKLSSFAQGVIETILIVWIVYQVVVALQILINFILTKRFAGDEDPTTRSAISALGTIGKVALWAVGILMILSNLGINITSLVAGLGIGGIAIAFALQNILSDLFSSFAIYFDKPFRVGDFIIVGDKMGTVEKIGIKTTRLKALRGEELIISNQELTSARVQNFKHMEERRISFSFGVAYETPNEKLERIPGMVRDIFSKYKDTARLDRAHLKEFGDFSLNFDVVYYVLSSEYAVYMDTQQSINLKLKEQFEKENIVFAYPTQTIYMAKG